MKAGVRMRVKVYVMLLLVTFASYGGPFVDVTTEVTTVSWSYKGEDDPPTARSRTWEVRCVVGTNCWFVEWDDGTGRKESCAYNGTNLVWRVGPWTNQRAGSKEDGSIRREFEFDGDIDSGKQGPALMHPAARLAWLAFCSGPQLKKEGQEIPTPSTLWKQTWLGREFREAGFRNKTVVFEDEFGLPRSIDVFAKSGQAVFQYRLPNRFPHGPSSVSTNVCGWEVPLEFHAVQYAPSGTNSWAVIMTGSGKVISAKVGKELELAF